MQFNFTYINHLYLNTLVLYKISSIELEFQKLYKVLLAFILPTFHAFCIFNIHIT